MTGGLVSKWAYGTYVHFQNTGPRTLHQHIKVAYALEGSPQVWHTLLKAEPPPEALADAPSHMELSGTGGPSGPCRAWVGE
jgi:hypothetical protein